MCALANVLGFFAIPIGLTSIHLMQLPIILTALSMGSRYGAIVGFIGPISMSYRLSPINPYILLGNAILGFFTGFLFTHLKEMKGRPAVPQVISVLAAFIIQVPYIYVTDVYLMPLPSQVVLTIILPKLLLENIISVLLCHFILFRIDIQNILANSLARS